VHELGEDLVEDVSLELVPSEVVGKELVGGQGGLFDLQLLA
jgi:hypothetical protein